MSDFEGSDVNLQLNGGYITTSSRRRHGAEATRLKLGLELLMGTGAWTEPVDEDDLVIINPDGHELYREGPYSTASVEGQAKRLAQEVKTAGGLESFLAQKAQDAPLPPATIPGRLNRAELLSPYLSRLVFWRRKG